MASIDEVAKVLRDMAHLPNCPITDENASIIVNLYHQVLRDLPTDILEAAALHYRSKNVFFPSEGTLREKAVELQLLTMNVPTPAEAWGMVMSARSWSPMKLCAQGAKMRDAILNREIKDYWQALWELKAHIKECKICVEGGRVERYDDPIVERTVQMLGGLDVIMTDNPTADRARFIEAYKDVISRESTIAGMVPEVRSFVERSRAQLPAGKQVKQLAERLTKKK